MPLSHQSLGLALPQTIEFAGIGPPAMKRPIDRFDYVIQPQLKRVDVVAPPSKDWIVLFNEWFKSNPHVSLSIRGGTNVLLTLNEVIPLHFRVQPLDASASKVAVALLSFGSRQVAVARVQPVALSTWDRYLPQSVRNGIRLPGLR